MTEKRAPFTTLDSRALGYRYLDDLVSGKAPDEIVQLRAVIEAAMDGPAGRAWLEAAKWARQDAVNRGLVQGEKELQGRPMSDDAWRGFVMGLEAAARLWDGMRDHLGHLAAGREKEQRR